MKFKDLKLATKQSLFFALILFIMAGANFYSINKMALLKSEIEEVSNNWLPRAIAISDINLNTSNLRRQQLQHAFTTDEENKQQRADNMVSLIHQIAKNLDMYEELKTDSERLDLYSDEERELYASFDQKWEAYQDLSFTFFQLSRDNENKRAIALLNGVAAKVFDDFSSDLVNLVNINTEDARETAKRAEATFTSTRRILRTLLLVTIAISILLAFLLVRLITVPLLHLVQAAGRVANGDLDVKLNIKNRDEVGKLTASFNRMTIALREAREKEQQQARLREEAAEQRARAKEAEAKLLKAENERTSHELEGARKLQLSMLPQNLPKVPHLDITAYMKTATEVGGDYYDFKLSDDGTLTVAIGDAAGHGAKAGIFVTGVKILFEVLASNPDIPDIFQKMTRALKRINSGGEMFMAMTLLKIKDYKMKLVAAGMPYTLIWRAGEGKVEEIEAKGIPLGSFDNFPYEEHEIQLHPGDTIVLMSDGFPERLNDEKEMLDYPTVPRLVEEWGRKSTPDVIKHLLKAGDEWANGRPLDDDMTFVTMKVK